MSGRPPLLPWTESTWGRWSSMTRMSSSPIPRTKFLLLKAPVSTLYEEKYGGDRHVFTVAMYGGRMTAKQIRVGAAVDCTILDLHLFDRDMTQRERSRGYRRYYHNPVEWDDFDVDYHTLEDVGAPPAAATTSTSTSTSTESSNGIVFPPSREVRQRFLSIVTEHWKSSPNAHIALFDSRGGHGVAAYLAAVYMCERMRAPVHAALDALRTTWAPGLCDVDLIRDLQIRYKGRKEWTLQSVPDWWWAVDDDDDDEEEDDDDDDDDQKELQSSKKGSHKDDTTSPRGTKRKQTKDLVIVIPPFDQLQSSSSSSSTTATYSEAPTKKPRLDQSSPQKPPPTSYFHVPGVQALPPDSPRYARATTVLTQLTNSKSLPLPTETLLTTPSTQLTHGSYRVTWRSVGRRGLLLILSEGTYFLEKQHSTTSNDNNTDISVSLIRNPKTGIGMHFPNPKDPSKPQHRTLLDGILVQDQERSTTTKTTIVPRYLASDILCHMGSPLMSLPWTQRMKFLMDGLIQPRKRTGKDYVSIGEPLRIRAKEYFDLSKLSFVLKNVLRAVTHQTEKGVMFVPETGGYFDKDNSRWIWDNSDYVSEDDLIRHCATLS